MNSGFFLNGYLWRIQVVKPDSNFLVDRTNKKTLATTDPLTQTIYISENILASEQLTPVLLHEMSHCVMLSFNLIEDIHKMVKPEKYIEAEEWLCNYIVDYGIKIFNLFYQIVGSDAWLYLPRQMFHLFA